MTPSIGRARQSIREASYANARARVVLGYLSAVNTLLKEIVGGDDDPGELLFKVGGIREQGDLFLERMAEINREASLDDRETSVPPYLGEKAF